MREFNGQDTSRPFRTKLLGSNPRDSYDLASQRSSVVTQTQLKLGVVELQVIQGGLQPPCICKIG